MTRYWDEFEVGARYELGSKVVSEEEIIAFGKQFDPLPFHVDPVAARESVFGGLVASGWHTSAMFMRMLVDTLISEMPNAAGLGLDDVRFRKPVRPGDTLTASATVIEARPSRSRPDRGVIGIRGEQHNQHGELVWDASLWSLVERNPEVVQNEATSSAKGI